MKQSWTDTNRRKYKKTGKLSNVGGVISMETRGEKKRVNNRRSKCRSQMWNDTMAGGERAANRLISTRTQRIGEQKRFGMR